MPATCLAEWETELEALCQLRMMLAGLAFRHGIDGKTGARNAPLGNDVAAIQSALQKGIDRMREAIDALRALDQALKAEGGRSVESAAKETLH